MITNLRKIIHAHHEAGHAVLAVMLSIPLEYVTIVEEGLHRGKTQYKTFNDLNFEEQEIYRANIVIATLAGGFAAKEFEPNMEGALQDDLYARSKIDQFFGNEDKEIFLAKFRLTAEKEVDNNRKYINAVAKALLDKETLTEKEVKDIIGSTL